MGGVGCWLSHGSLYAFAPLLALAIVLGAYDLFDNEEDGCAGALWYQSENVLRPYWLNAYIWSAWRNSVNNQRRLPLVSCVLDSTPTVAKLGPFTVVSCGWRQCVYVAGFRFGWLISPTGARGDLCWQVVERFP